MIILKLAGDLPWLEVERLLRHELMGVVTRLDIEKHGCLAGRLEDDFAAGADGEFEWLSGRRRDG